MMFDLPKFLEFGARVYNVSDGTVTLYISSTGYTRDELLKAVEWGSYVFRMAIAEETTEETTLDFKIGLTENNAMTVLEVISTGYDAGDIFKALLHAQLAIKKELDPKDESYSNHTKLKKEKA